MLSLTLKLRQGTPLRIAEESPDSGCDLPGLQNLIGGRLTQETGPFDLVVRPVSGAEANYSRFEEKQGCYSYFVALPGTERDKVLNWRKALLLAFAARILRGDKIMPVHGCLLKNEKGEGLLLCGQSGIGKSTTAKRWKIAGGTAAADDMILLEYGENTLYAHPLPTWSRCLESVKGESVPFEEIIPLQTVLALSRDEETESIRDVEGFKYMSIIYSACALFNLTLIKNAESGQQQRLAAAMKTCAQLLYDRYPHRIFYANLQGNIRQTLNFFKEFK